LFAERDDYVRYVGEAHAWSSGMWMSARRELVLYQQANREAMMQIVRHEAFHQYLSHATCMLGAAPWVNEGHACLFEHARVDNKGRVTLPEDPERAPVLLENLETAVALLPYLLQTDYEAFYDGTQAGRRLKYAMAWGLAYYLHKGVPLERVPPHARVLDDYLTALGVSHDQHAATQLAFAEVEMETFQAAFRDFCCGGVTRRSGWIRWSDEKRNFQRSTFNVQVGRTSGGEDMRTQKMMMGVAAAGAWLLVSGCVYSDVRVPMSGEFPTPGL
jgi:hypothetical protein